MQSITVFLVIWKDSVLYVEADKQWVAAWICNLPDNRKFEVLL